MTEESLICPIADQCPVYQNWVQQTEDRRLDIICGGNEVKQTEDGGLDIDWKGREEDSNYNCLALLALYDPVIGIPMGRKVKERLEEDCGPDCSWIMLINQTR